MGPKKQLGQHFLTSPAHARRIADAVPAVPGEPVLEIGPGRGALSIFLKERFPDFHLVEVDREAIGPLRAKLGEGDYTVHNADVLKFDYSCAGFPLHVAGNLPYNIGAMIIKKTLLYGTAIRSCTFMVQREVAERIVASPHGKRNGFLSIFCQFFGTPRLLFHVPPGAFFPRPAVDSSVFQLIIDPGLDTKLSRDSWEDFFAFVSRAFQKRRKKLSNALSASPQERARLEDRLKSIGCGPASRPEDLGISEWLGLYRCA